MEKPKFYEGKTVLVWQKLESVHFTKGEKSVHEEDVTVQRTKVFGGWLVRCMGTYDTLTKHKASGGHTDIDTGAGMGVGLAFVPDPNHEWDPRQYSTRPSK